MTRKLIQFAIILLASLTLSTCDSLADPSPNEVLSNYLDAFLKGRYEELYSYVSADDKAVKDLQSYLKENKMDDPFLILIMQVITSTASYKILKIEKSGKKATADVEMTSPDLKSMFFDIMGVAFKSAFGSGDEKEMEKTLAKKFESGEISLTTEKETFKLVKEEDGWKVFLDWKTEKIEIERRSKIQALLFEEKQAYIKNVMLYDLKAKYYKTYSKEVPGVEFKIKNKGDRSLKKVEVTVYFKDASGTIIAEEDYRPVWVKEYFPSSDDKPLKPNYIWQKKRGGFYKADSVPSEWKEGAVSAKITNIEFEE